MKVLKFGGTSVGSAERMQHVASLVSRLNEPCIVVLSAVSGTTNALVEIYMAAQEGRKADCAKLVDQLEASYTPYINGLFQTEKALEIGKSQVASKFKLLRDLTDTPFNIIRDKEILSLGELLSTRLFHALLIEQNKDAVWLNALDFMFTNDGEPDFEKTDANVKTQLAANPNHAIYVTQGFICRNEHGEVDNLKRGGSDYTASILGATVDATEIQIWTDIDGIHNNDPRFVSNTKPINALSFDEAAEMAYFGAKVLHPSTVHPAKQKNIPVRLLNTMEPEAKGTLISNKVSSSTSQVKAVAAKDGITAINIKSHRMLMAHGFLQKVFEIFERYTTSIDMITTSEVAVSVTIDNASQLDLIKEELETFALVQVDSGQTIVCVVGDFKKGDAGIAVRILESLNSIPLRMISSGGSESNISVLIDAKYKVKALELLNQHLFHL